MNNISEEELELRGQLKYIRWKYLECIKQGIPVDIDSVTYQEEEVNLLLQHYKSKRELNENLNNIINSI